MRSEAILAVASRCGDHRLCPSYEESNPHRNIDNRPQTQGNRIDPSDWVPRHSSGTSSGHTSLRHRTIGYNHHSSGDSYLPSLWYCRTIRFHSASSLSSSSLTSRQSLSFLTFSRHLPIAPVAPKLEKSKVHSSLSMPFGAPSGESSASEDTQL